MGNVKITTLPKGPRYAGNFTYADLHLDIKTSFTNKNEVYAIDEQKDLVVDYDLQAIKNSIVNILTTSPGEKILNPTFGLDLRDYLFEPVSEVVATQIASAVLNGLIRQEPRITFMQRPTVVPNIDDQSYSISMELSIPYLDIREFLFQGLLNFQGFSVINI